MKKCASCTKDLPDAALHCVFCGAKQPPAPAVQQGLAKTAFGYSANDMIEQIRQQGGPAARPAPPAPYNPPPPPAYNPPLAPAFTPPAYSPPGHAFTPSAPVFTPPVPVYNPPPAAPAYNPPPYNPPRPAAPAPPPPYNPPQGFPPAAAPPPSGFVPQSPANAATMFVQTGPSGAPAAHNATVQVATPAPSFGRPNPATPQAMAPTLVPPPPQQQQPPPQQPAPMLPPRMAIPASQPPPYLASHTASRIGRPVEPWKDTLRIAMFFWGVALLAVFAVPLKTSPGLVFNWNLIIDGDGTARLPPLMFAAVGLLSVIVSGIPMQPAARGLIAAVLGLAGIMVPIALVGVPPWQVLSAMIGMLVLVPGLFVRGEYRAALVPRILVTLGAIAILLPVVLPHGDAIPLVSLFKSLIDQPGSAKVAPALAFAEITIVVMSLLAWLPAPVTGAATLWAWLLILWALITHLTLMILAGHLGDAITGAPNATLVSWIAGGSSAMATGTGIVLGSAYLVLVGYGLASVVGKQLE